MTNSTPYDYSWLLWLAVLFAAACGVWKGRYQLRQKAHELLMLLIALLFLVVGVVLVRGVLDRFSSRSIEPDEESVGVLHVTRRHWFVADEKIRLEARPDADDTNRIVWQAQAPNGEWYEFFYFEYE